MAKPEYRNARPAAIRQAIADATEEKRQAFLRPYKQVIKDTETEKSFLNRLARAKTDKERQEILDKGMGGVSESTATPATAAPTTITPRGGGLTPGATPATRGTVLRFDSKGNQIK